MKIASSLLQTIGLALLIPITVPAEAQVQQVKPVVKTEKDSIKVKPQKKNTLISVKGKTGQLKPIPKEPKPCPPCGRG